MAKVASLFQVLHRKVIKDTLNMFVFCFPRLFVYLILFVCCLFLRALFVLVSVLVCFVLFCVVLSIEYRYVPLINSAEQGSRNFFPRASA